MCFNILAHFSRAAVEKNGTPPSPEPLQVAMPASEQLLDSETEESTQELESLLSQQDLPAHVVAAMGDRQQSSFLSWAQNKASGLRDSAAAANSLSTASNSATAAAPSARAPTPPMHFGCDDDPKYDLVKSSFDFASNDEDDLRFSAGTIIVITLRGEDSASAAENEANGFSQPAWWRGYCLEKSSRSKEGAFPSNYVKPFTLAEEFSSLRVMLMYPSGMFAFAMFLRSEFSHVSLR